MYSNGPPHIAVQKQGDQHEHTFSSYVRIRDVVLKTCLGRWTIGRSGERGSRISVLPARHDDDDDDDDEILQYSLVSSIFLSRFSFFCWFFYIQYSQKLTNFLFFFVFWFFLDMLVLFILSFVVFRFSSLTCHKFHPYILIFTSDNFFPLAVNFTFQFFHGFLHKLYDFIGYLLDFDTVYNPCLLDRIVCLLISIHAIARFFHLVLISKRMCRSTYSRSHVPLVPLWHLFCSSRSSLLLISE